MKALILAALLAVNPTLVREIAVVPCEGPPVYIFVFDTGSVAVFDLQRVTEDERVREIFMKLMAQAEKEITLEEVVLRQQCPKEGVST